VAGVGPAQRHQRPLDGQAATRIWRMGDIVSMNIAKQAAVDGGWDADQLRVIEAEADARLVVEAGPGTGKTAVACARLAYMIGEEDVEPSNTWMISFTRTAVA